MDSGAVDGRCPAEVGELNWVGPLEGPRVGCGLKAVFRGSKARFGAPDIFGVVDVDCLMRFFDGKGAIESAKRSITSI